MKKTIVRVHFVLVMLSLVSAPSFADEPTELLRQYCFDCHEGASGEGGFDFAGSLRKETFDGALAFENLITARMPPADAEQPTAAEKQVILKWLAARQKNAPPNSFRRLSRHEFVHSVNDLLGTKLNLANEIPDDRGTNDFDSDRRIGLSKEMLADYFTVADRMLENAFPTGGFPQEQIWITNKLKDSHQTYNIYVRDYKEGVLFSWTRANNGNSYSFFYDNFDPPAAGWYELTFDAMKVGDFKEDVSIQVHAGKYYYADDRPQRQRLLDVISLGNRELKPHSIRVFLKPGENVSVHCYSKHTFRKKNPEQGAYIKQLKVRGPLQDQWPPTSFQTVFADLVCSTGFSRPSTIPPKGSTTNTNVKHPKTRIAVDSSSPDDLKDVIRRFAERAFSSNLTDAELDPYFGAALENLQEHDDFVRAAKVGFKAIICSPRFLMAPGEHANPSDTTAAELARILWLSVPDAELLRAANNGFTATSLREQIGRMLNDPRSDRMIQSFCDQWLNLRSWDKVSPSLKLYPRYDDLLHHYLPLETRAYVSHLIRENLPVGHLIDSDFTFLNQRLAQHYGIEGVYGQRLRKVSFGPNVPRGGLMTMGSVLKITTDGFDTSPILRGAWISKNIVGTPISPPPETVKAIEPDHGEEAATLREQIEQHKNNAACYACHKSIDPYGFALENFDAAGQWREKYRVSKPHKGTFQFRLQGYFDEASDVEAAGEVGGDEFKDVFGLKKLLAANHQAIGYNFAKKLFEYATGYQPNLQQRLAIYNMLKERPEDCKVKDLVVDVLVYAMDVGRPGTHENSQP